MSVLTSQGCGFSLSEKKILKSSIALYAQIEVCNSHFILAAVLLYSESVHWSFFLFCFQQTTWQEQDHHGRDWILIICVQASCLPFALTLLIYSDTGSNDPPGLWCYWKIRAATWEELCDWPVAMVSSACWCCVLQKSEDAESLGCPVVLPAPVQS